MVKYLFVLLFLSLVSYVYLFLARKYNIIDQPNERGTNKEESITAGGIVFYVSLILFFIVNDFEYPLFFVGITMMAIISFIDDLRNISIKTRFIFQFLSVSILLLDIINNGYLIILIIPAVFFINCYNFMDGINGITGLYSLVSILGLFIINMFYSFENYTDLMTFLCISILVFLYYNFRKKALFFAGDTGSIVMGMIVLFLLIKAMFVLNSPLIISISLIYFVDSTITILRRLILNENIFKPHRRHLYQNLYDKTNLSQIQISIIYSICQIFLIVVTVLNLDRNFTFQLLILISEIIILTAVYIYTIKRVNHSSGQTK